ncbi:MAG: MFS transporter [Myxococcales bacterium]|nr:MFS transporter [Myxococcales bacterium]
MSAPTYAGLLRSNVDFRRLWLGVVVSFFGDWFTTIALYAVAQELSTATQAISAVLIAKTLPIFAVSPLAGPLVDRFDRRTILLVTDVARSVLTLGLVVAYWAGSLPAVLGVLVLRVAFSGVFIPARTAVIPQITNTRELPVAMALSGGTWSVMLALGAATGGAVTAWVGITGALLIDSVTFLVSAAFLWGLPSLPPQSSGDESAHATFADGLRFLRGRVLLPVLLLCKSGLALASATLVTLPLYGNGLYVATASAAWVGVLYAARGLGALVGSVGVRKVVGDQSAVLGLCMIPGFLWTGAWLVGSSMAPTIGWASLCYGAAAVGNGTVWVFSGIIAQRTIPQGFRGRLFALEFGVMTLVSASSSWLAGLAMDEAGFTPQQVNLAAGGLMVLPALIWSIALWWEPLTRAEPPVQAAA